MNSPHVKPDAERGIGPNRLMDLYGQLLLIRRSEERLSRLFADGEVPGFIHLSIGQEAVSVGVMSALTAQDTIASTHRGHGHAIAKGLPLDGFFLELLARDEGLCRGRGGSMHVADMSVGMLGANGIVGAGLSIALGSAIAHQQLGRDTVAVAFFGDGALAEGLLHECFNLASLWGLPLLFVCENNGWSEFLPSSKQISFKLRDLAAAYKLPHVSVDGNDVAVVSATADSLVAQARKGQPAVIECITARMRGHFEGDAQKYRDAAEIAGLADRDPILVTALQLQRLGVSEAVLRAAADNADQRVEAAVAAARGGRNPDFEAAKADVYTPAGARHG
ncbi:thiamine pyrophosphate-dependent dehydrogenase E1 component subunit alpha [Bradyrhizobium sp.]|uniref:thiamine pyrophosphate-dependent dehydrogenase E1 component subunit alpha n=1 Tax=Bradyrhizobium sp. TaxID=376 RepID=UPI003C714CEB